MSLTSDLEALAKREKPCDVPAVLAKLLPEEVVAVDAALGADRKIVHSSKIAAALRKNGYQITDDAVQAHRRGDCSCRS